MDNYVKPRPHASRCCVSCGNRLDVHEAVKGDYCSAAPCLSARIVDTEREKQALHEQALDKIATDYAQAHFGSIAVIARVPSMERSLVRTDPEWLARFRRNLRESIREAAANESNTAETQSTTQADTESIADANVESSSKASVEDTPANSVSVSCEVCRGSCCAQGADHAFLSPGFIQSRLAKTPGLSAVSLYREYLQLLPSHSYDGACVYQGSNGCALPRDIRSDTCNRYECSSRKAFAQTLKSNPEGPVAVIAMSEKIVHNAVLIRQE